MEKHTIEDGSSRGDVLIRSKSLSCHDRRLEGKTESDTRENLIAKPCGGRRLCVERVDEAAPDGRKARSENQERSEEAEECDQSAYNNCADCYRLQLVNCHGNFLTLFVY